MHTCAALNLDYDVIFLIDSTSISYWLGRRFVTQTNQTTIRNYIHDACQRAPIKTQRQPNAFLSQMNCSYSKTSPSQKKTGLTMGQNLMGTHKQKNCSKILPRLSNRQTLANILATQNQSRSQTTSSFVMGLAVVIPAQPHLQTSSLALGRSQDVPIYWQNLACNGRACWHCRKSLKT